MGLRMLRVPTILPERRVERHGTTASESHRTGVESMGPVGRSVSFSFAAATRGDTPRTPRVHHYKLFAEFQWFLPPQAHPGPPALIDTICFSTSRRFHQAAPRRRLRTPLLAPPDSLSRLATFPAAKEIRFTWNSQTAQTLRFTWNRGSGDQAEADSRSHPGIGISESARLALESRSVTTVPLMEMTLPTLFSVAKAS